MQSEESIVRLLEGGRSLYLCHNYQRLLADAGWKIEHKWYFHGVRYASGVFEAGETLLHVSRGVSGYHPLRWRCRPELTQLVLTTGAS